MADAQRYSTIAARASADLRDRGSKFLAFVFPVSDTASVKAQLSALRKEHPKATHHCYAYRLGTSANEWRAVDDGEPSGSAGRPILAAIDSAGLTDVLAVVVRYFGGTLLGVAGLIAAYRGAATEALVQAGRIERWIEKRLTIEADYSVLGEVLHLLKSHEATVYAQEPGLFSSLTAGIPLHRCDACLARLSEIRGVTLAPL
jgi:uncharacterized YigZ family protein